MDLVGPGPAVTGPGSRRAATEASQACPGVLGGLFDGLLDDAAMFPPGELPMEAAIPAYERHRAAWYTGLLGTLVFPAARLGELPAVLAGTSAGRGGRPVELSLTVPGGPDAVLPALRAAGGIDGVRVAALEVALPAGTGADGLIEALDATVPDNVLLYMEVPRDERRPAVLTALAGTRHRAKFRTGGVVPEAHPPERELAEAIVSAVSLGVPFKCTAGLHHALRHTDGDLEQHGFLNVLLAAEAADAGADAAEVAVLLAQRSGEAVTGWIGALGAERVAATRHRFLSVGTCSIADPVGDLTRLGLMRRPVTEPSEGER